MSRLQEKYTSEVAPALMQKFQYKSVMPVSYTHLDVYKRQAPPRPA